MLNKVFLMGRLTKDPELRYTTTNVPVASFTIAVDRDYKTGGDQQADFVSCVAWRQGGEFISKYFQKGSMIVVVGALQSRTWTDRDGNKRTSWEVVVEHSYFGDSKRMNNDGEKSNSAPAPQPQGFTDIPDDEDDGELPFD